MLPFLAALLLVADDLSTEVKRFVDVLAAVQSQAAEPVQPAKAIYEGAIPGMLRRLDPHSVFFDPVQFEQLRQMERSTRKGFGSVVSVLPGRVIVLQTMPGTPSAKSGMAPGDEILSINGIPLRTLDVDQLVEVLGEARQRQVKLDVRRAGNARPLQFVLTPEEMASPSVERAYAIRPGVAYLRVSSFDEKTGAQLREALESLGGASLQGLVLDLRNNPGGVLDSALETAALFLKPGMTVLSVRGRSAKGQELKAPDKAKPYEFPLAVIVNGKTASASEIVSGAIQDNRRGTIVGEQTFGKGLVQSVMPLSQGTGLALTTAFYYTPAGRSIQRPLAGTQLEGAVGQAGNEFGIQPDVRVLPEAYSRLRAVLDASGSFASFATDYLQRNRNTGEKFEVTPALLDELQVYLSQRNIRPGLAEWSADREWMRSRLKQEIFNQALGVEKGDQVEAQRDPQIQQAITALKL